MQVLYIEDLYCSWNFSHTARAVLPGEGTLSCQASFNRANYSNNVTCWTGELPLYCSVFLLYYSYLLVVHDLVIQYSYTYHLQNKLAQLCIMYDALYDCTLFI